MKLGAEDARWACSACDYDLCLACARSITAQPIKRRPVSSSISATPPPEPPGAEEVRNTRTHTYDHCRLRLRGYAPGLHTIGDTVCARPAFQPIPSRDQRVLMPGQAPILPVSPSWPLLAEVATWPAGSADDGQAGGGKASKRSSLAPPSSCPSKRPRPAVTHTSVGGAKSRQVVQTHQAVGGAASVHQGMRGCAAKRGRGVPAKAGWPTLPAEVKTTLSVVAPSEGTAERTKTAGVRVVVALRPTAVSAAHAEPASHGESHGEARKRKSQQGILRCARGARHARALCHLWGRRASPRGASLGRGAVSSACRRRGKRVAPCPASRRAQGCWRDHAGITLRGAQGGAGGHQANREPTLPAQRRMVRAVRGACAVIASNPNPHPRARPSRQVRAAQARA